MIGDPTKLSAFLARLDEAELKEVAGRLKLLDPADAGTEALIAAHGKKETVGVFVCAYWTVSGWVCLCGVLWGKGKGGMYVSASLSFRFGSILRTPLTPTPPNV